MNLRRILVVYKKSSFELYAHERKDPHFLRVIRGKHMAADRFRSSHDAHARSMEHIRKVFERSGVEAKFIYRSHFFSEEGFDLVATIGGDGTFLEASHRVQRAPMLGINSSPSDSVGIFCGITSEHLERTLEKIGNGKFKPIQVTRLAAKLEGKSYPVPILNDVLIAHENPAATSRYILKTGEKLEEQKSSGVWISTGAGSTAAIEGAGGAWMSIKSRSFQFLVREPYEVPERSFRLKRGRIAPGGKLIIYSKMRTGRIYIDGPHISEPFPIGSKIELTSKGPLLQVFAFNETRRRLF